MRVFNYFGKFSKKDYRFFCSGLRVYSFLFRYKSRYELILIEIGFCGRARNLDYRGFLLGKFLNNACSVWVKFLLQKGLMEVRKFLKIWRRNLGKISRKIMKKIIWGDRKDFFHKWWKTLGSFGFINKLRNANHESSHFFELNDFCGLNKIQRLLSFTSAIIFTANCH